MDQTHFITLTSLPTINIYDRLHEIWKTYYQENTNIVAPLFPECVRDKSLLFLSLNPSLSKDNEENTKGVYPAKPYPALDCNKTFEDQKPKAHKHFKKFFDIITEMEEYLILPKEPWTFLDLIYIRQTDQKEVEKLFYSNIEFIQSQVDLTLDIIKEIEPKLVIVANRFAETILLQNAEFKKNWLPDDKGVWRYNGIPFIMRESGFLGSRYLNSTKKNTLKGTLYKEIRRVLTSL